MALLPSSCNACAQYRNEAQAIDVSDVLMTYTCCLLADNDDEKMGDERCVVEGGEEAQGCTGEFGTR